MKLRAKIVSLMVIIVTMNLAIAVLVLETTTIPAFRQLADTADRKDVERVLTGFDAIRNALHVMAYDYALWNDTYQYFHDRNADYIDSNYVIDTFIGNSLDLVAFADRERHVFWHRIADREHETFFPASYINAAELVPLFVDATQAYPEAPVSKSGFVKTSLGPIVFSSYSVHRSDGSGESPGAILLGRLMNDDDLSEIRQLVKIPFSTRVIPPDEAPQFTHRDLERQHRNTDDSFDWFIADINGKPLLALHLQLDPSLLERYQVSTPAVLMFLMTVLSCVGILAFLSFTVIRPMLAIQRHIQHVRLSDEYSARLASGRHDEIGDLSDECDRLIAHIEDQNLLLEEQSRELKRLSLHDSLTGLGNRRYFDQVLEEYWSLHRREQSPLSFILCDIDYFKRFNDSYGHLAGDEALKRVAGALRASCSRQTDKAARYGGEEFGILLADTDSDGALAIANTVRTTVEHLDIPHEFSTVSDRLTISIGCATLVPGPSTQPQEIIRQADIALYRAKGGGRNTIVMYDADSDQDF